MSNLFIPTKIKVGFQQRRDTFTGKLAYVTYFDERNNLRKEKSWQSWRDQQIEPIEFENKPMNGFILNKGIQRSSEWFGSGRTMFRVYAPLHFEFEVNADNLINLLTHSDISKQEIMEQCVFAWRGTELVLLPTNSVEYQQSILYTDKQQQCISAKDLIKGARYYLKKSNDVMTYIGYFDWYDRVYFKGNVIDHKLLGKKHIFTDGNKFVPILPSKLSSVVSMETDINYVYLVDKFFASFNSQKVKAIKISPLEESDIEQAEANNCIPMLYSMVDDILEHVQPYSCYPTRRRLRLNRWTVSATNSNFKVTRWDIREYHITGHDPQDMSIRQYIDVMATLGFHGAKLVLENGAEISYNTWSI